MWTPEDIGSVHNEYLTLLFTMEKDDGGISMRMEDCEVLKEINIARGVTNGLSSFRTLQARGEVGEGIIKQFADDTKISRVINSEKDSRKVQQEDDD
eukprot:g31570.t1